MSLFDVEYSAAMMKSMKVEIIRGGFVPVLHKQGQPPQEDVQC